MVFFDANGRQLQAFDFSSDSAARDFASCSINPSNDTAVVGAFNRLYVFSLSNSTGVWQHTAVKQVRVWMCDTTCLRVLTGLSPAAAVTALLVSAGWRLHQAQCSASVLVPQHML